MPAQHRRYRRSLPATRAVTAKFVALAVAATLAIGGFLAIQMAAGGDPALGPKESARTRHASNTNSTGHSGSSSAGSGAGYYGGDQYPYGSSASGYSPQQYSPPPVTSSTS
jgi:hypothetical protein